MVVAIAGCLGFRFEYGGRFLFLREGGGGLSFNFSLNRYFGGK